MFGRSPIADIHHHLTVAPVDIDRLAAPGDVELDHDARGLSDAERRYRKAIVVARRRLIAEAAIRATADRYLVDLINHHARTIMMPRHLVLAAFADGVGAAGLATHFAMPSDVVETRLRDTDLRHMAAPASPMATTQRAQTAAQWSR